MSCCRDWMNWWGWRAYKNTRSVWPLGIMVALEIQIPSLNSSVVLWNEFLSGAVPGSPCSPLVPTPTEGSCDTSSYRGSLPPSARKPVYSWRHGSVFSSSWKLLQILLHPVLQPSHVFCCNTHISALVLLFCLPGDTLKSRTIVSLQVLDP